MKAAMFACAMVLAGVGMAAAQGVVTKQYEDGGVYEGTFRNGRQHGQGSYTLPSGYRYEGDWVDGQIVGQGRATYPNGSTYEGHFDAGKPHGKGKITYADGGTYDEAQRKVIIGPNVRISDGGSGFTLTTPEAVVDTRTGVVTGSKGVQGTGPLGTINASSYAIHDQGERVVFQGAGDNKVRGVINPSGSES